MPLPKPREGESRDDFLSRCMANSQARRDFPDRDQRFAVCNDLVNQKSKKTPENGNGESIDLLHVNNDKKQYKPGEGNTR